GTPGTHPATAPRAGPPAPRPRSATASAGNNAQPCRPPISVKNRPDSLQDLYEDHPHIMHDRTSAIAPINQICANRGRCRHVSLGTQNGGSARVTTWPSG